MSSSTITIQGRRAVWLARMFDYVELTKPKIAILVLITVAAAGFIASWGQPHPVLLLHTLFGTALVAASASALNQWLERRSDALMDRTLGRPLPSGRLANQEVLFFGAWTLAAGLGYLALTAGWMTASLGALTWALYVFAYTPLKSRTHLNTAVGAVAGAMPVLIGWAAVGGRFDLRAMTLFLTVFLWQFPHFMAIAWIYRRQYGRAGLKMLTVVDPSGRKAGVQSVLAALALLPVSYFPAVDSPAASLYLVGVFLLGAGQLGCAIAFLAKRDQVTARWLLRASLVYLPSFLILLMLLPLL